MHGVERATAAHTGAHERRPIDLIADVHFNMLQIENNIVPLRRSRFFPCCIRLWLFFARAAAAWPLPPLIFLSAALHPGSTVENDVRIRKRSTLGAFGW